MPRRPCFLIVEPEPAEALSARKLVIETAKYNVITAYSGDEALRALDKFPNVDGVVIHSEMKDVPVEQIARAAKEQKHERQVILLQTTDGKRLRNADHHISSHEPGELVDLLRTLYGDPRRLAA
jgi:response regulator RpfG family c-di-GMP phosphodiesterase